MCKETAVTFRQDKKGKGKKYSFGVKMMILIWGYLVFEVHYHISLINMVCRDVKLRATTPGLIAKVIGANEIP